jgi:hypothetical protein
MSEKRRGVEEEFGRQRGGCIEVAEDMGKRCPLGQLEILLAKPVGG